MLVGLRRNCVFNTTWKTIHVFAHTSAFESDFHSVSGVAQLPYPTDDTRLMTRRARQVVKQLYIPVHAFLKAGIGLIDIVDRPSAPPVRFASCQAAREV